MLPASLSSEVLCPAISFTGTGTWAVKQWEASFWTNIEKRGNEAYLPFCLCFWHDSNKWIESARAALSPEKRRISPEWQELKTRVSDSAVPMPSVLHFPQTRAKLTLVLVIDGMPKRALNWSAVTTEDPAWEWGNVSTNNEMLQWGLVKRARIQPAVWSGNLCAQPGFLQQQSHLGLSLPFSPGAAWPRPCLTPWFNLSKLLCVSLTDYGPVLGNVPLIFGELMMHE